MKLINLLSACFVIALFSHLSAQEITFSEQETFSKGLVQLFPNTSGQAEISGNYFLISGNEGTFNLFDLYTKKGDESVPEIAYYENNAVVSKNKLDLETPNGKARFIGLSALNGEAIVFMSQKDEKYERCYYQQYTKRCIPLSEPILVSEKELKKDFFGFFSFLVSKNQEFICLKYLNLNNRDIASSELTFEILNRNLKVVGNADKASLNIRPGEMISNTMISNDGSLVIGTGYPLLDEKGKSTKKLDKFKVYTHRSGKVSEWEYKIPYTNVESIEMVVSEQNDQLVYLAGIGSEGDTKMAFYVQYDLKNEKEISHVKNVVKFDTFMYQPKKLFYQDNGVVFVMERLFGGASTTMGAASTTPKDYCNNVLLFKVEEAAEVVPWNTVINKEQVFLSSLGLTNFGSIKVAVAHSDGNGYIFFNDNVANYNEQGVFIATEKNLKKLDGKQEKKLWSDDNGLAMVKIDLSNGKTERKLVVKNKGIVKFLVNDSFVPLENGQSALFFIQKAEIGQVGNIRF